LGILATGAKNGPDVPRLRRISCEMRRGFGRVEGAVVCRQRSANAPHRSCRASAITLAPKVVMDGALIDIAAIAHLPN
jgi:hypothetical protein